MFISKETPNGLRKPRMLSAGYPLLGGVDKAYYTENAQAMIYNLIILQRLIRLMGPRYRAVWQKIGF
jgi:hypothetical protein